ncbi:hypothetical protein [Nocardioides sp. zg-1228]|uniref:hypothetical protein n=1 Tax=Nocardioides sp. zg-1228 TaxID=2763008 RepID=UPI001642488E|nr:hypothetical protein [Nocardioides sp. zg-1228]MBC2931837.1 hypothetical protein [Nocardioides sp. zg-1228]QSF57406.1 hypothetical protein JX575_17995 [Nocardioides sp. zg-1228]
MAVELVLTRSDGDRRRHDLDGVGTIRRGGWWSRSCELVPVEGPPLTAAPQGRMGRAAVATDTAGVTVGRFAQKGLLTHGGELVWRDRPLRVRSEALVTTRYSVSDGDTALLEVRATGRGRTPARVSLHHERVDPGLVLFSLWLVQDFIAQDSSAG